LGSFAGVAERRFDMIYGFLMSVFPDGDADNPLFEREDFL